MRHYFLYLVSLILIAGCDNENLKPEKPNGQKELQQVELHFPGGQIVFDSLFYTDSRLVRHANQSTGWLDIINYSFEYNALSTVVFYEQNGIRGNGFLQKDTFNDLQQLIETVINKTDGDLLVAYNYVYNPDNTLIARKAITTNQIYTDSISVDSRGNLTVIKRIQDDISTVISYDENPNPFYQLPLVNSVFQTRSPNNLTQYQVFSGDSLSFERTYKYQYDQDGYPTEAIVQESLPNNPLKTYYFYY